MKSIAIELADIESISVPLKTPSEFIKEYLPNPQNNPVQIIDHAHTSSIVELVWDKESVVRSTDIPFDRPLFRPEPSNITLQNYLPFKTYELVINFRNLDKCARRISIEPTNSPHFSVHGWKNNSLCSGKVAPGMDVSFIVKFKPEENVDYAYSLVCITEREKFLLPIKTIGARGVLDLPDDVIFGDCPVNYSSVKTLLVRNIGNALAKFDVKVDGPFSITPNTGCIEIGQTMQMDASFLSKKSGSFESSLTITFHTGETVAIRLTGTAENISVKLEKNLLRMENTSITLASSKLIRIFNKSDTMVSYIWKRLANENEDQHERKRQLLYSLNDQRKECDLYAATKDDGPKTDMVDISLLAQKYNTCARIIQNQSFSFQNTVFQIEPLSGIIWPGAYSEVKVQFSPLIAGIHEAVAYCQVEGRETRLPLQLKGEALGPVARFSYDLLDLDNIFINTSHTYEVILENKGEIPTHFCLEDVKTIFGSKFSFTPNKGSIGVGEKCVISILFCSNILGNFLEEFCWSLEGTSASLILSFKGTVIGPTFHFEPSVLDFGSISYGFSENRALRLFNTSDIPMSFHLRLIIPDEDLNAINCQLDPSSALIEPLSSIDISVNIDSRSLKSAPFEVLVDIENVGVDMMRLPVFYECVVPEVNIVDTFMDLGDCYLCHGYDQSIKLVNSSNFSASFQLVNQEKDAQSIYTYTSDTIFGVIQPNSSLYVSIKILIKQLGQISFPVGFHIQGRESSPLVVNITANGIGPNIELSNNELNWGKIQVLKKEPLLLCLHNKSPIFADFRCTIHSDSFVFTVHPQSGTISPGQKFEISITAHLDDVVKFTDILKINVQFNGIHEVKLVARGQGTTIVMDEGLRNVDFSNVFSNCECSAQFTVTNKGRRTQTIHWTREENHTQAFRNQDVMSSQVFEIIPPRFVLKPGTQQTVYLRGYFNKEARITEKLICQAMLPKDPSRKIIFESSVTANFVSPLIEMTPNVLKFLSVYTTNERFTSIEKKLALKNTSALSLHMSFKCPQPFYMENKSLALFLKPQESAIVSVFYDSLFNLNRISSKENAKLQISYREHPQKDAIELQSDISFPNLTFSANSLKFGCVGIGKEHRETVWMVNTSTLPVHYQWYFVDPSSQNLPTAISQVFDIQPLLGLLYPGEKQEVEVYFYSQSTDKFNIKALCDVEGGPKYELALQGEASAITFSFDKTCLAYGTQSYQSISEQEIVLTNTGLVQFDYTVTVFSDTQFSSKIMVSPAQGTIIPRGKQKILVRYCPCVPEVSTGCFYIQIAHFEPIEIQVTGVGSFPRLSIDAPRATEHRFDEIASKIRSKSANNLALDVEAETELLLLIEKTWDLIDKLSSEAHQKMPYLKNQGSRFVGSILLFNKWLQLKISKKFKAITMVEFSHVKLAKYVCDYGIIIRNTTSQKSVRIFNNGNQTAILEIDKSVLFGTGFSFEPEKVKALSPGEGVELLIQFHAKQHISDLIEIELPITISGGATVLILLRATITTPELQLSQDCIDFGEVVCGYRKTVTIQFTNPGSVSCDWSYMSATNDACTKKQYKHVSNSLVSNFEMFPSKGSISPQDKIHVKVCFSPRDKGGFTMSFPIKINMNSKSVLLRLSGTGVRPIITFEPETISVGPAQPFSDGVYSRFSICNRIKYPIEIVAIDFDQQFQEEEDILRQVHRDTAAPIFLAARELGASLPEILYEMPLPSPTEGKAMQDFFPPSNAGHAPTSVFQSHQQLQSQGHQTQFLTQPSLQASPNHTFSITTQSSQQRREQNDDPIDAASVLRRGNTSDHESLTDATARSHKSNSNGFAILTNQGPISNHLSTMPESSGPTMTDPIYSVIVHGPPFSGRTCQAKRIANTYGKHYINIDEELELRFPLLHSNFTNIDTANVRKEGTSGRNFEDDDHSSMVQLRDRTNLHSKDGKDEDTDSKLLEPVDDSYLAVSEETILDILKHKIHPHGVVIDGLESKFVGCISLLKTLLRYLTENGRRLVVFNFGLDVSKIRQREVVVQRMFAEKELESLQIKELSEDEYDLLGDQERTCYDLAMRIYKKRAKEIEDRHRVERCHLEDAICKPGDRKTEDSRLKGRKKSKTPTGRAFAPEKHERTAHPGKLDTRIVKTNKVPPSPKGPRKTLGERFERVNEKEVKASEKADRANASSTEKEAGEDAMSRFGITEDTFLSDITFRRTESYFATLETFYGIMKDSDKSVTAIKNYPLTVMGVADKKMKPGKTIGVAEQLASPLPQSISLIGTDMDQHILEDPSVNFHDINVNSIDEDSVFKTASEYIHPQNDENGYKEAFDQPHSSVLEQVYYLPQDRLIPQSNRIFTLLPSSMIFDDGDQPIFDPTTANTVLSSTTAPTNTIILPASSTKSEPLNRSQTYESQKQDSRRTRSILKPSDEIKQTVSEQDEDIERETIPKFRWILNPGESRELCVKFSPTEIGKFEQSLNFESVGARGHFSVQCAGFCQYPHINTDFKKMFSKWRRHKDEKIAIHGEYISSIGQYEFGPLLISKSREKYQERFPENKTIFNIINSSSFEAKVSFALRNDSKGEVFFFEPAVMDLAPLQAQSVSVWAYPKTNNHFEDIFIICVKDNPEPYSFKVSCIGVKPELEVDKKTLSFDKLLLSRSERREIKLRNPTHMPVVWKLAGIDALGDEFTISPVEGTVESFQEIAITAEFRGIKPIVIKRVIHLEVYDVEKIGGTFQDVPIVVTAEAYDISMDLHFSKGFEGGLDFGVLKVLEEGKHLCTLKNKGKYEVGFRFLFEGVEFGDFFVLSPMQGIIQPSDKPFFVQIVFKANTELHIKDSSALRCIVFEPTTGEITASIPIKINARAVFSKFSVLPMRDLNFGALVHGSKASRQFIIENQGEFDFKYSIYKLVARAIEPKIGTKNKSHVRLGKLARAASPPPATKSISNRKEVFKPTDTLNSGAFTLFPTSGIVAAGTKQSITVEFHSDNPGHFDETIGVDVSDRSPEEGSDAMEYRLVGESCIPGINTTDFSSIFEEQSVCKRLELFTTQNNVYAEDDRIFHFGAYLVGQQVTVNFKISNPFKVPCDISLSTKPRGKSRTDSSDFAFDVETKKLTIPSHEYRYVSVIFHPASIQPYAGIFEATVENVQDGRNKTLSFELRGEGTLPRIVVDWPILKSKAGLPLLKFKKLLLNTQQTLPIVLRNDGIIPARFKLEWTYKDTEDFECPMLYDTHHLKPQEQRTVEVKCRPMSVKKFEGELRLKIMDNTFEDSSLQLVGEGYLDDLTFEGLSDDSENEIIFGDCFIDECKQKSFKLRNHSSEWVRIFISESSDFVFNPTILHIKPRGDRDVCVTFSPKQTQEIQHAPITVKSGKLRFQSPPDLEWDSGMKVVRWIGSDGQNSKLSLPRKVLEQYVEPTYEAISPLSEYTLLLSAFSDYSMYECDQNHINFKSTLMYQSRVHRFSLRNSGKVILKFAFVICLEDGTTVDSSDLCPFSINPASGTIPLNESLMITVRFSPIDVGDYCNSIVCSIPNLGKDAKPLSLTVRGTSLRPLCHFELEDSDYLTSERRNPDCDLDNTVPAILDPNIRVIEFSSCGVRGKNIRRFYIVNPTAMSYEFMWHPEVQGHTKFFKCLNSRGIVASNKKSEIVFEFTPESTEIKESLWIFTIPEHQIQVQFLLVGQAVEPKVYVDHTGINFKSVLVGRQVKEIANLINRENVSFSYSFSDISDEIGHQGTPILHVLPNSGIIPACSQVPIQITFAPPSEKSFNFNLQCNIRKKSLPVTINVKGEGYEIHDSLHLETVYGSSLELASSTTIDNIVDFGQVQINEKRVKRICIVNSGIFNFDFSWKLTLKSAGLVTIKPEVGTVLKGDRMWCEIAFIPTTTVEIKGVRAVCSVVNGHTYPLTIQGTGVKPLLKFSESSVDFGSHFVFGSGMTAAVAPIQITNVDIYDITFDIVTSDLQWLEIQRGVLTLAPGESTQYTFSFVPRQSGYFSGVIKFEINGLSYIDFPVKGEAIEHRIETDSRQLSFGALRIGQTSTRSVKIFNKSKLPTLFSIGPSSVVENLLNYGIHISQVNNILLKPKSSIGMDLKFVPHHRIPAFTEELRVEAPGVAYPLFAITGACQGIDVRLENDIVTLGAVVQQSSITRRIQLQNIGEIGTKFHWNSKKFLPDFSISPSEGYISPGMEIPLEITFHPIEINPDVRYENISCEIEGSANLYLTLTGMCIPQPVQNDAIKFSTPVRSPDTKSIPISNKTSNVWHIRPIIDNEYWSGAEVIDVEPGQSKMFDITFNPLETIGSGEGGRHEGSVFFPLPDGSGILHKLYGTVDKPLSAGNINREIPSKTSFTEVLNVGNWLKRPQRLRAIIEVLKPDPSIVIKGNDFVDLSPLLSKDYKLTFYAYKEGVTNIKIIFKNETSQEYISYSLTYKSTAPGVIACYDMTTAVRQTSTHDITISNPLSTPALFSGSSNNPDVIAPHSFTIQPKSEGICTIEFLPLIPKEASARITLSSVDLGLYQYDLRLISLAAQPERTLQFKVGFGSSQVQTFRFTSFSKVRTDFTCKIDNTEFTVEKSVSVAAATIGGVEVSVDVIYEPSKLGDTRTQLIISSPLGGDYICPLNGHCAAPRPQGPILIKSGSPSILSFKNVLSTSATFNFVVDNPIFVVKAAETVASKKLIQLSIGFKPPATGTTSTSAAFGAAIMQNQLGNSVTSKSSTHKVGKLTITHTMSNMTWVYYLRYVS
ncbi:hypothetical protein BDV3_002359 [Batrachochytrium dendrobatidis]